MNGRMVLVCLIGIGLCLSVQASVTEISVARGSTLVGVKSYLGIESGANGKPANIIAVPLSADHPQADPGSVQLSQFSDLGGGDYRFKIHANEATVTGTYLFGFLANDPLHARTTYRFGPIKVQIHVTDIIVRAVSFQYGMNGNNPAGSLPVYNPVNDQAYGTLVSDDPESGWDWKNGVCNWPIRYVRGMTHRYVRVLLEGPPETTVEVGASEGFGQGLIDRPIHFDAEGRACENFCIADSPVSKVASERQIVFNWHAHDRLRAFSMNNTSHRIYITGGGPSTLKSCGLPYWQVLEIGSRAGGTLSGIRSAFNRHLRLPADPNLQQETTELRELKYYGALSLPIVDFRAHQEVLYEPDLPITPGNHQWGTTRMLLVDGDGHCGAFARLEYDVLQYQGIDADLVHIYTKSPHRYFRVKFHTAQGRYGREDTPPRDFSDHCVVQIVGVRAYEDPSYGTWYPASAGMSGPLDAFVIQAVQAIVDDPYPTASTRFSSKDLMIQLLPYS